VVWRVSGSSPPWALFVELGNAMTSRAVLGTDVATRYVAEQLSKDTGQNLIIENRPGAGGNIGAQCVARAPAEGYTLLMGTNGTHAAAPFLFQSLRFDPIALIGILPLAIATTPSNPLGSVEKLVAAARVKPDSINVPIPRPPLARPSTSSRSRPTDRRSVPRTRAARRRSAT